MEWAAPEGGGGGPTSDLTVDDVCAVSTDAVSPEGTLSPLSEVVQRNCDGSSVNNGYNKSIILNLVARSLARENVILQGGIDI